MSRNKWSGVLFSFKKEEGDSSDFYIDLYLAHKIIYPIIKTYEKELELWKFHRRIRMICGDICLVFTF